MNVSYLFNYIYKLLGGDLMLSPHRTDFLAHVLVLALTQNVGILGEWTMLSKSQSLVQID